MIQQYLNDNGFISNDFGSLGDAVAEDETLVILVVGVFSQFINIK